MAASKEALEIQAPVSSKGQVTIPKEIRERLGVSAGERVSFVVDAEGKVELRLPKYRIEDLFGILKPLPMPIKEQIRVARKEHAASAARKRPSLP